MAVKKSDLYSSLWASCDELRGGMDASQYKDYVLFMLFIKYVSDKYGDSDAFAPPIVIPDGASFADMSALKGRSDIGERINTQIIQPLVDANASLARSDFPDFDDSNKLGEGQAKVERLTNLVSIFEKPELDFSQNRAEHDDLLGDAYEYLMRHFATQSGKSKGQFYTPAEVSRVIAQVIGISADNTVASTTAYDPTCGSGSLLLKVAAEAGKQITLEGQEEDVTTAGLARMNMVLHSFPTASILPGDTLANPRFKDGESLRTYDYVVANPPFSDKTWSNGIDAASDPYGRFGWGVPPRKNGDYAFLLHIIRSMKRDGKGACILPHGVLFRGNAEAVIRRELVQSGYLKGIIGLPPNLFYGTGIPACILVLDKENAVARKGIFMIDASRGFCKDGAKNRLRERDIHQIVDTFRRQADVPGYARMVPFDEIADPKNDFNLNLPRYIDSSDPEDLQDIDAHLNGGIPERDVEALADFWAVMPGVRESLFEGFGRDGYLGLKMPMEGLRPAIVSHAEFEAFQRAVGEVFDSWWDETEPKLRAFDKDSHPKRLIGDISESLLAAFEAAPLVEGYSVYQRLMDYWAEVMQDDAYLISADGWVEAAQPHEIRQVKNREGKLVWPEEHDYLIGKRRFKSDLIPAAILIDRYFGEEQDAIEALDAEMATLEQELAETLEEGSGEEGLLAEVIEGEKQKITEKAIKGRLKEIGSDAEFADEREALERILEGIPSAVFTSDDGLGWVYQYWQANRKDEVNRAERKIEGADICAVTQLFTEPYMVRFLLQNTLGAWWLSLHPDSPLRARMEFHKPEVQHGFTAWPASLSELRILDPCCGSGHFLVEAYKALLAMSREEDPEADRGVYMGHILLAKNEAYSREVAFHTKKGCRANVQTRDPETGWCYKNGGQPLWGYRSETLQRGEERRGRPIYKSIWVPDDTIVSGRPVFEWTKECLRMAAEGASLDKLRDFCNSHEIPAAQPLLGGDDVAQHSGAELPAEVCRLRSLERTRQTSAPQPAGGVGGGPERPRSPH